MASIETLFKERSYTVIVAISKIVYLYLNFSYLYFTVHLYLNFLGSSAVRSTS